MKREGCFLLFFMLMTMGCIEAGSLSLPDEDTKIDLSQLGDQLKEFRKSPSSDQIGVPIKSLPRHFLRSAEHGSYSEAFTLGGLPSTTIVWTAYKDPFGKEYERIRSKSRSSARLIVDDQEITAVVADTDTLYRISSHLGLYTFVAETKTPREIDSVKIYGTHEEVVKKVFEAGVENALAFDLDSLGN
jgi:hypothetical protein